MGTKPFYTSTTFVGLLVAAISSIYMVAFGTEPTPEEAQGISQAVAQVFEWAGLLVALYGRWKATQPLSALPTKTE